MKYEKIDLFPTPLLKISSVISEIQKADILSFIINFYLQNQNKLGIYYKIFHLFFTIISDVLPEFWLDELDCRVLFKLSVTSSTRTIFLFPFVINSKL